MLSNLQEIMSGGVTHAAVRLWSEELTEAEAAAVHHRAQNDRRYQQQLDRLLAAYARIEPLEHDPAIEAIVRDYPRLLRARSRRRLALGLAVGFVAALGAVLAVFMSGPGDRALPMHFTRIGEQKTLELNDGSLVTLNTGSQVIVDYSGEFRRVLLERGEAFFDVAEDSDRPFTVDLGTHAVTAMGTAFNIRVYPDGYQIAVIGGEVAFHEMAEEVSTSPRLVSADSDGVIKFSPMQHLMEAGWVVEFDLNRNELAAFRPESITRYQNWRSGLLSFNDEPLLRVVEELNRYSRRKILIDESAIMELPVYMAIRVIEIDGALRALERALPIAITWHYDRIVITASRKNGQTNP